MTFKSQDSGRIQFSMALYDQVSGIHADATPQGNNNIVLIMVHL